MCVYTILCPLCYEDERRKYNNTVAIVDFDEVQYSVVLNSVHLPDINNCDQLNFHSRDSIACYYVELVLPPFQGFH